MLKNLFIGFKMAGYEKQAMRDYLTEADRCAHKLDRNGALKYLKAAMDSVGYDLDETFERQLGVLMIEGKGIGRECISSGSKGNVPGWNGAATVLREHMKQNGSIYVQLYYRVRRLIAEFNQRLESEQEEYTCDPISLYDVKEFDEKDSESELETRVDDKAATRRMRPRLRIEGDLIKIDLSSLGGGLSPA